MGVYAFGGPAAHIALMQQEVVEKRKWMDEQHFLDLIGITSLVPGPNSTEMVMHSGKHRAGVGGLFAAGLSFILPAVLITLGIAVLYNGLQFVAQLEPWMMGIKSGVIGLILMAVIKLGKKALKNWQLWVIGIAALVAGIFQISELLVILASGVAYFALQKSLSFTNVLLIPLMSNLTVARMSITSEKIFLIFLKIGATLFGSGYLLFSYLESEFVLDRGWLTYDNLAEGIAVGNVTPGPVLSSATYFGFELGGYSGAALATLGIFLPSFLIIWLISGFIPRLRASKTARLLIDGVNVGALAMMLVTCGQLGREILIGWEALTVFGLSLLTLIIYPKVNSFLFIGGCSVLGFCLQFLSL